MKKLYFSLCLCLLFYAGNAQTFQPLTWGEIYDYEVGDTFITARWWDGQPPIEFTQTVITSKSFSAGSDTVKYGFETKREMNFMGNPPSCCQGISEGAGIMEYSNLTDTALQNILPQTSQGVVDTAVIQVDSLYSSNGITYNRADLDFYTGPCTTSFAYGAGLGDTYYFHMCYVDAYEVWMEYYHKKNGAMAGQPREFVTGVKEVANNIQVVISPNPVKESFQLQLSAAPASQTYLHVYDALGREVRKESVLSSKNTFNRNGLAAGIYLWQLQAQGKILSHGRLAYE